MKLGFVQLRLRPGALSYSWNEVPSIVTGELMAKSATVIRAELADALERLRALLERSDIEAARTWVRQLQAEWPDDPRVRHWATVLAPPRVIARRAASGASLEREKPWIREHAQEYPGCWIALDGERLIAADPDLDAVIEAAQSDGAEDPLLHFQPDPQRWR